MRRILICLLTVLLLWGCEAREQEPAYISVSLSLPEGCGVVENGLQILSGEDAVFELILEENYRFNSLAYDGEYTVEEKDGLTVLRLMEVRYPTRAEVELTNTYCTVVYEPNGGQGETVSLTYDRSVHLRPNTSQGTELFSREGHTLVGWNTEPDGSGTAVGLGSRVSVPGDTLTLYAQWAEWSSQELFDWELTEDGIRLTGYHGTEETVVVPAEMYGAEVTVIGIGCFTGCQARHIILPPTMKVLQMGGFTDCALEELTFFDNIEAFGDVSFENCPNFSTVHINAAEPPWGYDYRQESCYADKMDILIEAAGQQKLVFYGGCSMWYNLDGAQFQEALGDSYRVINMGLNGVINSYAQMQILTHFLEEGDVLFHTPEISSDSQLMIRTEMINHDRKLWSGLEYNYDLVSLLDIRTLPEFFDIYYYWISTKECTSSYEDVYRDSRGNSYVDEYGSASFYRNATAQTLGDKVRLDPAYIDDEAMERLDAQYQIIRQRGVTVYVGYACMNLEAVPEEQQGNVDLMDGLFRDAFEEMEGITVLGSLQEQLYSNSDFYDTNYHLRTEQASRNTAHWLELLRTQMTEDGLWPQ